MRWLLICLLAITPALAADIHVLVDLDSDGNADPCPNPAHDDFLDDDLDVACGGTFDIDNDTTAEAVYCEVQTAIHNMTQSDTIEVHVGTYSQVGAKCDEDCGELDPVDTCGQSSCWTTVAFFPGISGGYGTAVSPGYLRGAVMNGSTDTWDTDGDREPDGALGVIFSGDNAADGETVYTATTCSANSCSGDTFGGIIVGCMSTSNEFCRASPAAGRTNIEYDSDGNGSYDISTDGTGKTVGYLVIKDIQFQGFNAAHANTGGTDARIAHINLTGSYGTNTEPGPVVDHIYWKSSQFAQQPAQEAYWSIFGTGTNSRCPNEYTEIKNSLIVQQTQMTFNNDCGTGNECGCSLNFHDNRVIFDINDTAADNRDLYFAYIKSVDTQDAGGRPDKHRIWNSEFIFEEAVGIGDENFRFLDLQIFGNGSGNGQGELWVYGNIFRDADTTPVMSQFWWGVCTESVAGDTKDWDTYFLQNTLHLDFWNSATGVGHVCGEGSNDGENATLTEKGNVYLAYDDDGQDLHINETGSHGNWTNFTHTTANEKETATSGLCDGGPDDWFADCVTAATRYNGLTLYAPKTNQALDNIATSNPCDPDGDGSIGMDYDGDGTNDTTWTDIAGNTVTCACLGDTLDAGAIQGGTAQVTGDCSSKRGISVITKISPTGLDRGSK